MTTRDVLVKARSYIERGHTTRAFARNAAGDDVPPEHPGACCWCILGALLLASPDRRVHQGARRALMEACGVRPPSSLDVWNDAPERTQADVLDAFNRAIAAQGEP